MATEIANSMILNRTARFFDPEVTWQSLEDLSNDASASLLPEQHVKRCGEADLFLGLVAATGERALWLKIPGGLYEQSATTFPDSLWVKTIGYADYSLLTVVLTDPAAAGAFTEFARTLLNTIGASPTVPAASVLFTLLQSWQPQFAEPMRYAA